MSHNFVDQCSLHRPIQFFTDAPYREERFPLCGDYRRAATLFRAALKRHRLGDAVATRFSFDKDSVAIRCIIKYIWQ